MRCLRTTSLPRRGVPPASARLQRERQAWDCVSECSGMRSRVDGAHAPVRGT